MLDRRKIRENLWDVLVVSAVLAIAVFVRFFGITDQGFHDGDEYAKHYFYTNDWYTQILGDKSSGSLWGRPSAHFLNVLLGNVFGYSADLYLIKTALLSSLIVLVTYIFANKFLDFRSAILASALVGGSMTFVYWSHTSKEIIQSTLFFLLSLYFLARIIKRYELSAEIQYKDAIIFGFLIGLAFTFHPNLAITVIASGIIFGFTLLRFSMVSFSKACKVGAAAFVASTILLVIYELFFIYILHSSLWFGERDIGYLKNVLWHSNLRSSIQPSLSYYSGLLGVELFFSGSLAFLGILFGFFRKGKWRAVLISLSFIVSSVVLVYANSETWPAYRNIAHLLVPAYILAGAMLSYGLEKLNLRRSVERCILLALITLAYYPALSQLKENIETWSTAEKVHWLAGGGEQTAMFRAYYHWYFYYFPYNLVNNMGELWSAYLCGGVDYLVSSELSTEPALEPLMTEYGELIYNSADTYDRWLSAYLPLNNIFEKYTDEHGHKLVLEKSSEWAEQETKALEVGTSFREYVAQFDKVPDLNWVTISGDLKSFGGLREEDVAVVGVGSLAEPFKYGYKVIEADVLSKNRGAQLVANNKGGFFKIGFVPPTPEDDNLIMVRAYLMQTDSQPSYSTVGSINLRGYRAVRDTAFSCQNRPVSLEAKQRLVTLISEASLDMPQSRLVNSEAVGLPGDVLEPGAHYRLAFRYELGIETVARVEVTNYEGLVAHQLYFKPNSELEFLDFQAPYDLGDALLIYFSSQSGTNVKFSDVTIERIFK